MKPAVAILDATDALGRAAVQAALDADFAVIAIAPNADALAPLAAKHASADLVTLVGATHDEASAAALGEALDALARPLAGAIVCLCDEPQRGRVLDQAPDKLRRVLGDELLPQLATARVLVPRLAAGGRNGRYVVIGGPGDTQPWAGYGHRSIAAAATRMLLRVLHDEARSQSVRVQLLAVELPARTDANDACACEHWPTALAIGERAVALVADRRARERAEAVVPFTAPAPPKAAAPAVAPRDPDPAPVPSLDDTWALLKPLLSASASKDSRHDP